MGADGIDNLPHRFVGALVDRFLRRGSGGLGNGQDNVAEPFPRRLPCHSPHGRHHVNLRFARMQKQHGVQSRHVNALGQPAGIGQDFADAGGGFPPQPGQALCPVQCVLGAVHMVNFAAQDVFRVVACGVDTGVNDLGKIIGELPGLPDGIAESNGPLGRPIIAAEVHAQAPRACPSRSSSPPSAPRCPY